MFEFYVLIWLCSCTNFYLDEVSRIFFSKLHNAKEMNGMDVRLQTHTISITFLPFTSGNVYTF